MDAERLRRAARALADEASFTRAMLAEYMAQRVKDDDMARQALRLGLAAGNVRAALDAAPEPAQADPWAWAVLLPGNTPQQARIRMTEREAASCAAELPGFVIVPLYAAPSRPGGAP